MWSDIHCSYDLNIQQSCDPNVKVHSIKFTFDKDNYSDLKQCTRTRQSERGHMTLPLLIQWVLSLYNNIIIKQWFTFKRNTAQAFITMHHCILKCGLTVLSAEEGFGRNFWCLALPVYWWLCKRAMFSPKSKDAEFDEWIKHTIIILCWINYKYIPSFIKIIIMKHNIAM